MICDRKVYDRYWDQVLIPATQEQEKAAERFIFHLIGFPFDWRGMIGFLLPFFDRRRKAKYCSSIVLEVLQQSLHMFPGIKLKISPNGLYRLFVSGHPLLISAPVPDAAVSSDSGHDVDASAAVDSPAPDTPANPGALLSIDAIVLIGRCDRHCNGDSMNRDSNNLETLSFRRLVFSGFQQSRALTKRLGGVPRA